MKQVFESLKIVGNTALLSMLYILTTEDALSFIIYRLSLFGTHRLISETGVRIHFDGMLYGKMWYLIVLMPDLCPLSYFLLIFK